MTERSSRTAEASEMMSTSNKNLLPKCFCSWKHCRTYQKALREYKHPLFNGVVKLKFVKSDRRSMALKACIDRTLGVDSEKSNVWNAESKSDGEPFCRYYIARHHFTEALIQEYCQDRRAYDWNEPLSLKQAKKFLYSLEPQDVYISDPDDGEDESSEDRYVQAPNVPKDKVREMLRRTRDKISQENGAATDTVTTATLTQAFDELEMGNGNDASNADAQLAQTEAENTRLRKELNECQEQLSMLHSMVKQLQVDMGRTRTEERSSDSESEEEHEEWSQEQGGHHQSDDDETISTFHANGDQGKPSSQNSRISGGNVKRRSSIHSRRSIRRNSVHSRRESIHSRSRHSVRRDSYHSRRSMRGMDDGASVVSRQSQSLASVSPSIKSLPREIELMDDEEGQGKDDFSLYDESYRKPDDDTRSAGSQRRHRRSIVSRDRSKGPNSNKALSKKRGGRGGNIPQEIDLSGDELEDKSYNNVSNDTSYVTGQQIEDPYGEKGVYTGALSKSTNMPNGKGRLEYEKEGRWYEGDWIHGRWTGTGRLSNGDGDFYEGGLKNDHKHGTGTMRFADGRVFEGEYIRGQMINGKMTYQDGSVYAGSWVDGMRHGRGKCIFVDGSEYDGEFKEGNFHGQGKMTWNDGGWYKGEWCDGEMHGQGKEVRPDQSLRHDGEWSRGQPIRSPHERRRRQQG